MPSSAWFSRSAAWMKYTTSTPYSVYCTLKPKLCIEFNICFNDAFFFLFFCPALLLAKLWMFKILEVWSLFLWNVVSYKRWQKKLTAVSSISSFIDFTAKILQYMNFPYPLTTTNAVLQSIQNFCVPSLTSSGQEWVCSSLVESLNSVSACNKNALFLSP